MAQELGVKAARITREVLFRCVSRHVRVEILLEPERLVALVALERFLGGVHLHVGHVILLEATLERAKRALVDQFVQVLGSVRDQLRDLFDVKVTWEKQKST